MNAASRANGTFVPGPLCAREPTGSGPLDGMRLAVKDLIDVAGTITGAGNPDWTASHAPASADANCVDMVRAAGARVVGKTITDELGFSLEGENSHFGTPRHPLDANRLPGGSSSGSVAAVAWGEADLALGTDTGGSVRVPASFCGVAAMRPSHGRISLAGVMPFAPSFDTLGWFARDARLLRDAGHVMLGDDATGPSPALALCIATDAVALADAPVRAALLDWAVRHGITATRKAFDGHWHAWRDAYTTLQGIEIQQQLGAWIRRRRPVFGPAIAPRFEQALALDTATQSAWQAWRAQVSARLAGKLQGEAWLVPAAPCLALPRHADGVRRADFYSRALALGSIAGHAGLPQLVLPLASADGLPVGISFIAAPGQDERLLDLAMALDANRSSD